MGWPAAERPGGRVLGIHAGAGDGLPSGLLPAKSVGLPSGDVSTHTADAYLTAVKYALPLLGLDHVYVAAAEAGVCESVRAGLRALQSTRSGPGLKPATVLCQPPGSSKGAAAADPGGGAAAAAGGPFAAQRAAAGVVFRRWLADVVLLQRTAFLVGCQSSATTRRGSGRSPALASAATPRARWSQSCCQPPNGGAVRLGGVLASYGSSSGIVREQQWHRTGAAVSSYGSSSGIVREQRNAVSRGPPTRKPGAFDRRSESSFGSRLHTRPLPSPSHACIAE